MSSYNLEDLKPLFRENIILSNKALKLSIISYCISSGLLFWFIKLVINFFDKLLAIFKMNFIPIFIPYAIFMIGIKGFLNKTPTLNININNNPPRGIKINQLTSSKITTSF